MADEKYIPEPYNTQQARDFLKGIYERAGIEINDADLAQEHIDKSTGKIVTNLSDRHKLLLRLRLGYGCSHPHSLKEIGK